ncbi:unnamed protein product [Durusdinium trenchii]|uniref:Uncharacterized protein n=1 Tax=Durusdinium trenchii TaxID=1381693 RepID=A0ABP0IFS9_9DINO
MKSRQVAPDPHPPAQNGVTSVTAATRSFGWGDHSDAMSVMTRETRASAERRRPCSIELTVVLVLEVVIIIASVIILATMGSGDGITFRTDIGALICGLIILLGMLMLALLEIVTNGTKAKEVLLVYLQITIHFNAAALGALTLLGHATWLLAQLLLILAAFAWVVGCCGGAVSLWHWLYYQKVVPKPRMGHLLTLLRALHWKTAFFCWAVLVTLTVVALVFPKLPETVGLSQELSLAEHVLLMGTGGLCYSALFSPLFLALSRRARCTMRRVAARRSWSAERDLQLGWKKEVRKFVITFVNTDYHQAEVYC